MSFSTFYRAWRAVLILVTVLALGILGAVPIFGADSGTVNATVATDAACITVEANAVDFGTQPFSTPGNPVVADGGPDQTSTNGFSYALDNCSLSTETFFARGTDAADDPPTIGWSLDNSRDPNNDICVDSDGVVDRFYLNAWIDELGNGVFDAGFPSTDLGTTNLQIETAPASATVYVGNQMTMPCTGSSGAGLSLLFDIIYTATLN